MRLSVPRSVNFQYLYLPTAPKDWGPLNEVLTSYLYTVWVWRSPLDKTVREKGIEWPDWQYLKGWYNLCWRFIAIKPKALCKSNISRGLFCSFQARKKPFRGWQMYQSTIGKWLSSPASHEKARKHCIWLWYFLQPLICQLGLENMDIFKFIF